MQFLKQSLREYPAVLVVGSGRYLLFVHLAENAVARAYFECEGAGRGVRHAVILFPAEGVEGFVESATGGFMPLGDAGERDIAAVYLPFSLRDGLPSVCFFLPGEEEPELERFIYYKQLLLIVDFPWGQFTQYQLYRRFLRTLLRRQSVFSVAIGLLRDGRNYAATDISGDEAALADVQSHYQKRNALPRIDIVNIEPYGSEGLKRLLRDEDGSAQWLLFMARLEVEENLENLERTAASRWQKIVLVFQEPTVQSLFLYQPSLRSGQLTAHWQQQIFAYLQRVIYPKVKELLDFYLTLLYEEEDVAFLLRRADAALAQKLPPVVAEFEDEYTYRLAAKAGAATYMVEMRKFCEEELKQLMFSYVRDRLSTWLLKNDKKVG